MAKKTERPFVKPPLTAEQRELVALEAEIAMHDVSHLTTEQIKQRKEKLLSIKKDREQLRFFQSNHIGEGWSFFATKMFKSQSEDRTFTVRDTTGYKSWALTPEQWLRLCEVMPTIKKIITEFLTLENK